MFSRLTKAGRSHLSKPSQPSSTPFEAFDRPPLQAFVLTLRSLRPHPSKPAKPLSSSFESFEAPLPFVLPFEAFEAPFVLTLRSLRSLRPHPSKPSKPSSPPFEAFEAFLPSARPPLRPFTFENFEGFEAPFKLRRRVTGCSPFELGHAVLCATLPVTIWLLGLAALGLGWAIGIVIHCTIYSEPCKSEGP